MRIWDIHPGYLNRQSLLGEHRELHGLVSILVSNKKGYSKHPETLRWVGFGWAIKQRHRELVCEMNLRGYQDRSPVRTRSRRGGWPSVYIDAPHVQFALLKEKYKNKDEGRIPLPNNEQELWSHHKYSILARNQTLYRDIGRSVSQKRLDFDQLAKQMVEILRSRPSEGGIRNSLQHMWGHISDVSGKHHAEHLGSWPLKKLLTITQKRAKKSNNRYLLNSTALSELMVWL